jgi:hypothetical protein
MYFETDEAVNGILPRKSRNDIVLMLIHTTDEIVGDADIQRAAATAGKDVDVVGHLCMTPQPTASKAVIPDGERSEPIRDPCTTAR